MKSRSDIKVRKELLAIGAIVICLLAFYLYSNRKSEIAISVTIDAPFGGVFATETSCNPRQEYSWINGALKVTSGKGVEQLLPEFQFRSTATNQCAADFLLKLQPGQIYSVKFSGNEIGTITEVNFVSNVANFRHEIRVTRILRGYLRIAQPSDCRSSGNTFWCGGIKLIDVAPYTCEGYGGFSDMQTGTSVRIYSSTNQVIAQTNITDSEWKYKNPKKQGTIYCDLFWNVADVPYDENGYSVEMTERRGKVFFTKDQSADDMVTTLGE